MPRQGGGVVRPRDAQQRLGLVDSRGEHRHGGQAEDGLVRRERRRIVGRERRGLADRGEGDRRRLLRQLDLEGVREKRGRLVGEQLAPPYRSGSGRNSGPTPAVSAGPGRRDGKQRGRQRNEKHSTTHDRRALQTACRRNVNKLPRHLELGGHHRSRVRRQTHADFLDRLIVRVASQLRIACSVGKRRMTTASAGSPSSGVALKSATITSAFTFSGNGMGLAMYSGHILRVDDGLRKNAISAHRNPPVPEHFRRETTFDSCVHPEPAVVSSGV